jgi:hypothetical protein
MIDRRLNGWVASGIFVIALLTYLNTMAITTSFWDCGEFIACSYILGVPHPPGSPLYLLFGRIFTMFPISDDIGVRVNVISPMLSAVASTLTYLIIVRLLLMWKKEPKTIIEQLPIVIGGALGALIFTFSDSQWFNAVEAEVYAGSLFFTAVVIWLILKWMDHADSSRADRYILIIFYIIGLASGVHLLNILAIPIVVLIVYFRRHQVELQSFVLWSIGALLAFVAVYQGIFKGVPFLIDNLGFTALAAALLALIIATSYALVNHKRRVALVLMSGLLVAVGYSTYTTIYIRAGLQPAINENNPNNPERLVKYLNREQYGELKLFPRRAPFWDYQVEKMYIRYFGWQFIGKGDTLGSDRYISEIISFRGLLGLPFLLGVLGMLFHFQNDPKRAFAILLLFIATGLAIAFYLNQEDPQPRERDYAYTGSFFAFALWVGIGATALLEMIAEWMRKSKNIQMAYLVAAASVLLLIPAQMFAFNYREHSRAGNYVAYDYSYNILESCEPNAIIFTNGDNDTFPLWYLQYVYGIRRDVRVVNLSLLNTDWYIKQLRDEVPRVPIALSDDKIDQLQVAYWPEVQPVTLPVPRAAIDSAVIHARRLDPEIVAPTKPEMTFELAPTFYGKALRVQDIMVVHIITQNQFERPIYFAVTVSNDNKLNLDDYLRMDGLALRVMPVKLPRRSVDPQIMWANLNEKFKYRNLDNPKVYYDDNVTSLLQNYRSAFLSLAETHRQRGETDEMAKALDRLAQAVPETIIPTNDWRINLAIGQLYELANRPEEMKKRLDYILTRWPFTPIQRLQFANFYERVSPAAAESLARVLIRAGDEAQPATTWLAGFFARNAKADSGRAILERWIASHPEDEQAKSILRQMQTLVVHDSLKLPESSTLPASNH